MPWNWELPNWPTFVYNPDRISPLERQFLLGVGSSAAYLKTIETQEYNRFLVEILSIEGLESSRIEGEILDRESLQSSIKQHFGLQAPLSTHSKESGMAQLLCSVYESFDQPLTHEMLWQWHTMLFKDSSSLTDCGTYRTHKEPMQIVSNRYDSPVVFFEAPPSSRIFQEMTAFIEWFNATSTSTNLAFKQVATNGSSEAKLDRSAAVRTTREHSQRLGRGERIDMAKPQPAICHPFECRFSNSILGRAAIAHVYFESIHPFEDGNGRIGRVLSEKILSQALDRPLLIAISRMLEKRKKEYYLALEKCNRTLEVHDWVDFFGSVILQAQEESMNLLYFIIEKSKLLTALSGQINPRQTKVLLRMFEEGPSGFKGGLSAENYIAITKTTRATATRDLTDLVEKGALVKTGELRHTRYWLNLPMNGSLGNG
jgi:Fic family protein